MRPQIDVQGHRMISSGVTQSTEKSK